MAYQPGETVPVELDDNNAEVGDLMEVSGEGTEFSQVQRATDDSAAIGMLVAGDETTDHAVRISKPVWYLTEEGSYDASAGDLVAERADGTVSDTESDGTTAVTRGTAYGQVFSTHVRSLHVGDRIAVAVYR